MTRTDLTVSVNDDLKHIPRGSLNQSLLRSEYNTRRRNSLGRRGTFVSRGETLLACLDHLRTQPGAIFQFDADYFGM
jgi:hypothetical protein